MRPLDIPDDVWSEAVRRGGVVRSLVVAGTCIFHPTV